MDYETVLPEFDTSPNAEPILQYYQLVQEAETPILDASNVVFIKYENSLGLNDKLDEIDLNTAQLDEPLLNVSNLEPVTLLDGTTAYLALNTEDQFSQVKLSNGDYALVQLKVVQSLASPTLSEEPTSSKDQTPAEDVTNCKKWAHPCLYAGCGKFYATLHHLKVHERTHTGARPYKCEYANCNKAFSTTYSLKTHFRIHTGEKPYKCVSCQKQFKTSGDLQKHVRIHTGERPFTCPYEGCQQSFTTSNIRKVHLRTHTGERPYKCNMVECGKTFVSATNFKNHMRIHSGEKPYVCKEVGCTKRFTEYSSLYKHQMVHKVQKQKVCNVCGKLYRQTSTLVQHMKVSHPQVDLAKLGENIGKFTGTITAPCNGHPAAAALPEHMLEDCDDPHAIVDDGTSLVATTNDEVLITDMEGNPVILRKYFKA